MGERMRLMICAGMSRSGSTLQYQIAAATVAHLALGRGIGHANGLGNGKFDEEKGWLVGKREIPEPWVIDRCHRAIGIHRDPRDVVCSFMRWRGEQGRAGDFGAALDETITAARWFSRWEPHCSRIVRYDEFDAVTEAKAIAELFGREIDDEDARDIADLYTVERNRERMERIAKRGDWFNPSLMLTRAHVGTDSGASVWETKLTTEQVSEVQSWLGPWMEEHGYSVLDSKRT